MAKISINYYIVDLRKIRYSQNFQSGFETKWFVVCVRTSEIRRTAQFSHIDLSSYEQYKIDIRPESVDA